MNPGERATLRRHLLYGAGFSLALTVAGFLVGASVLQVILLGTVLGFLLGFLLPTQILDTWLGS